HWMDYFYTSVTSGTSNQASLSNIYADLLAQDWTNLNGLTNCGTGGIFNGRQDFNANYICTGGTHNALPLQSSYTGDNNEEVLEDGFGNRFTLNGEIFANNEAEIASASDNAPGGVEVYFTQNRFSCTTYLVKSLMQTGALPSKTGMQNVANPTGGAKN